MGKNKHVFDEIEEAIGTARGGKEVARDLLTFSEGELRGYLEKETLEIQICLTNIKLVALALARKVTIANEKN